MANGKIRFGKQSGGTLGLVFPDGIGNTEVTFPESGELVNKDYADLKVALADFTGTNVNLAASGYQKLPSGLIIQWGTKNITITAINTISTFPTTFPISFPNDALCALSTLSNTGTAYANVSSERKSTTGYDIVMSCGQTGAYRIWYIAIGY